jgi:hypothetical protein
MSLSTQSTPTGTVAAQPSAPSAADATRAISDTLHIPLAAHAKGVVAIPGLMRKDLEHAITSAIFIEVLACRPAYTCFACASDHATQCSRSALCIRQPTKIELQL